MKTYLFIFAVLTASSAIAQEPSASVPSTVLGMIPAQNAGTSFPTSVATESDLVSNGVGQSSAYQTKSVLNVRDYGVTANGSTDDTTAMQNAITAACNTGQRGTTLILPSGANIRVTRTLTVTKCSGLTIDGQQSQGQATIATAGGAGAGNAAIQWFGSAGGTVLEINQTRDSTFKNLTVFTNASNYRNRGANVGILVDEIGTVTNITSNDEFDDVQISNGTTNNSSFIGVDICPSAPGNCELINFKRLTVTCGGGTASASNNGTGVLYANGSAQPFYEFIHGYESSQCSTALDVETGNVIDIDGGLANQNYTDLFVNGGRNISYRHIRSERGTAQIVIGTASSSSGHDLTVEENSFAGLTNGTTTISFPFSTTGGVIRLIKNDWDTNSTVTPFGPKGSGAFVGVLDSQDNNYPNSSNCISAVFASSGMMYSSLNDQPTGGTCNYGGMHLGRPTGSLRIDPTAFGNLPKCSASTEGMLKPVSDSTTKIWGETITGRGSDHVLAYCDGANWKVSAM